jgi:hypothetical protein
MDKVFVPYFSSTGFTAGKEYPLLGEPGVDDNGNFDSVTIYDDDGERCFVFLPRSAHFPNVDGYCGYVKDKSEKPTSGRKRQKGSKWQEFMEYGVTVGTFVRLLEWEGYDAAIRYAELAEKSVDEDIFGKPEPKKNLYAFAPVSQVRNRYPAGTVVRVDHRSNEDDNLYWGKIVYVPGEDRENMKGFTTNLRTDACAHLNCVAGWVLFEDYPERWEEV